MILPKNTRKCLYFAFYANSWATKGQQPVCTWEALLFWGDLLNIAGS